MRLIDADVLIENIKSHVENVTCGNELFNQFYKLAHEHIIDVVNGQPTAHNDCWIPCSERLPEETECYFVTWRDRVTCKNYVEITQYDAVSQEWLDCICQAGLLGYDIIAWQPLPDPYIPNKE